MIDWDIYNERRTQLLESFEDAVTDFLDILGIGISHLVDILDWEDNEHLADLMGWTSDDDGE